MVVKSATAPLAQWDADVIVLGQYEDAGLAAPSDQLSPELRGLLERLTQRGEISGKPGEAMLVPEPPGWRAPLLLLQGLGKQQELDRGAALRSAAAAAKLLAKRARGRVGFCLGEGWSDALVSSAVCGVFIGGQGQDLFRAEKKLNPLSEIWWYEARPDVLEKGAALGECVNLTRQLVNQPPNLLFPASFVKAAQEAFAGTAVNLEVWDEQKLADERCGALLAVGQGSGNPPRLLEMRYAGGPANQPWLALVGKGVTFDSGGYSLKPTDGMKTMKCDMAGAATVLGALRAIARLRLPVNVVGLVGLVENLVSGNAFKLGDVLTARSGKTIEVLNTDAEGRLVLADVLDVAAQQKPAAIVDLATLTGACMVALGANVAGLMSNHQAWCERVAAAARTCGEPAWQLPMFAEYGDQIRSAVADIKNVGEGRYGGAITAAKFLEEFVRGIPWTHIDIAGPAFLDSAKNWIDAGGSGAFVQTLVELAEGWQGDPARNPAPKT